MRIAEQIPFRDIDLPGGLTSVYLERKDDLSGFYDYYPDLEGLQKSFEARKNAGVDRQILTAALHQQNSSCYARVPQLENQIQQLADERTFTVTTGHQCCLATGPFYFILKISSVIHISRLLAEKNPGFTFVPVFWMASEDHDFEEVNHFYTRKKKITWESREQGAVGNFSVKKAAEIIRDYLATTETAKGTKTFLELFAEIYNGSASLSEATRNIVYALFGSYGIVVIDGNDKLLKQQFLPEMANDLETRNHADIISRSTEKLKKASGVSSKRIQVHARDINLFLLQENGRYRINASGGDFTLSGNPQVISSQKMMAMLRESPQSFSPNVIMRPLYQEKVLPNIAYIGGPGEISYWLQLKELFQHHHIFYPCLIPRTQAGIITEKTYSSINKGLLHITSYFKHVDTAVNELLEKLQPEAILFEEEAEKIRAIFNMYRHRVEMYDENLHASAEGISSRLFKLFRVFKKKAMRSVKTKEEISVRRVHAIHDVFFPAGVLQERHLNISAFADDVNIDELIALLITINPLEKSFTVITHPS